MKNLTPEDMRTFKNHLKFFILFLFFLIPIIFPKPAESAPPLVLEKDIGKYPLGLHMDILEDKHGQWTFEEISSQSFEKKWVPSEVKVPNFSFSDSAYWLRLSVQSRFSNPSQWILEVAFPLIDYLDIYIPNLQKGFDLYEIGDCRPANARPIEHRNFVFKLNMDQEDYKTIYLRSQTWDGLHEAIPVILWEPDEFYKTSNIETLIYGLYFGFLFIIGLYNLFIFFATKDYSYLWYVLLVAFFLLWNGSFSGFSFIYFWPDSPWWANQLVLIFASLLCISFIVFSLGYLRTKKYSPKIHYALLFLTSLFSLSLLCGLFGKYALGFLLLFPLAGIGSLLVFITGISSWRAGYRPATYYLFAFFVILCSILLYASKVYGILPSNLFTEKSIQIGALVQIIVLAFGLADRINHERISKILAQEKALKNEIFIREAQEKAVENLQKYRQIVENALEGIFQTTPEGKFLSANPAMAKILGFDSSEDVINSFVDLNKKLYVNPEDRDRFQKTINEEGSISNFETKFFRKDGVAIDVSVNCHVVKNKDNKILYYEGLLEDITIRKQAEETLKKAKDDLEIRVHERTTELQKINEKLSSEINERQKATDALRESEEKYRSIMDNMEDVYYELDLAGSVKFSNKAVEKLLSHSYEELIGKNFSHFVEPSTAKMLFKEFNEIYTTGNPNRLSWEIILKGGQKKYFESNVSLVKGRDDKITGFSVLGRDVTEKKKTEEELKKAKAEAELANISKSEFLATMSHEIRTPMNAILGMSELLSETNLLSEQMDYVQTINSSGELLLYIINDILDFSKIEAGQIELEKVAFDLTDLMETVCKILAVKAHEKDLELNCRIAPDVHPFLLGDPVRLRQIAINLLGNAIKFTEQGEIALEVVNSGDPELLQFCVRDTGIGIPENKQQSVFDSFSQVDTSTTRKYGGTGLGLAICKRLVELMGGHIWIKSEINKGTRFYFTVKFSRTEPISTSAIAPPTELEGMEALVVDDNKTNRLICRELLSGWGATVREAKNGAQAIEAIADADGLGNPYHLVLLDLMMPVMDGFQVARQINEMSLKSPPKMIMLTSSEGSGEKARARELNIASYIVKPFRRLELQEGILNALGKQGRISGTIEPARNSEKIILPSLKILLAEDMETNRKIVKLYLKDSPVTIDIALNGKVVVEKYTRNTYDVVLMDIEMPEKDGLAATQEIRKWEQENGREQTPVIALTAHAFSEHRKKCLEAGCTAYLSKPLKKKELLKTLGELFGNASGDKEDITLIKTKKEYSEASALGDDTLKEPLGRIKYKAKVNTFIKELVPGMFDEISDEMSNMQKALEENDFASLKRLGHGFRGTTATLGFDELSEIFLKIEKAAKNNDKETIINEMPKIKKYITGVEIEYV